MFTRLSGVKCVGWITITDSSARARHRQEPIVPNRSPRSRSAVAWLIGALVLVAPAALVPSGAAQAIGSAPSAPLTSNGWTTSATTVATIPAGTSVAVKVRVTSTTTRLGLIDIELFGADSRPFQQTFDNQAFTAGFARGYTVYWPIPAGQSPGTYRVKVGVFGAGWSGGLQQWNDSATTFDVTAPSTTTSLSAVSTIVSPS